MRAKTKKRIAARGTKSGKKTQRKVRRKGPWRKEYVLEVANASFGGKGRLGGGRRKLP